MWPELALRLMDHVDGRRRQLKKATHACSLGALGALRALRALVFGRSSLLDADTHEAFEVMFMTTSNLVGPGRRFDQPRFADRVGPATWQHWNWTLEVLEGFISFICPAVSFVVSDLRASGCCCLKRSLPTVVCLVMLGAAKAPKDRGDFANSPVPARPFSAARGPQCSKTGSKWQNRAWMQPNYPRSANAAGRCLGVFLGADVRSPNLAM